MRSITPILCALAALCLFIASPPAAASPQSGKAHADPATVIDAQLKAALATAPKSADFPDSDAACLLDLATVRIEPDGTVVETTRKAYKLFNQRGRNLAEVNLFYNAGHQSLSVVTARTIKANGAVVPVK